MKIEVLVTLISYAGGLCVVRSQFAIIDQLASQSKVRFLVLPVKSLTMHGLNNQITNLPSHTSSRNGLSFLEPMMLKQVSLKDGDTTDDFGRLSPH